MQEVTARDYLREVSRCVALWRVTTGQIGKRAGRQAGKQAGRQAGSAKRYDNGAPRKPRAGEQKKPGKERKHLMSEPR